jgi:uncharacterized phiE125 gp8 family phage protein
VSGFLTLNTAAASTPVTLAEAKAHLRVDGSDEDDLITALVEAATSAVEEETGRALVTQTWDYAVAQPSGKVYLPLHPVASVSTLTYYDTADSAQTLTVSDYYLFKGPDKAWLEPKDNVDWPEMKDRADALTVTFVAGQAVADVPQALKQAVLLLVAHWFEHREAVGDTSELPLAYGYLTAQHKLGWVA